MVNGFVPPFTTARAFIGAKADVMSDKLVTVQPNHPATCQGFVVSLHLWSSFVGMWTDAGVHIPSDRSSLRSKDCKQIMALRFS